MTEIYLHIVARMADYMDTHPYIDHMCTFAVFSGLAVGYADETSEVNTLRSERAGLEEWARFLGSWDEQGMVTLYIYFLEIMMTMTMKSRMISTPTL